MSLHNLNYNIATKNIKWYHFIASSVTVDTACTERKHKVVYQMDVSKMVKLVSVV